MMHNNLFGYKSKVAAGIFIWLGFVGVAEAAVVEAWSHDLEIDSQGIVETLHWRVLMEDVEDVGEWNEFPIYLDENRELISSEAWVISPDGKRRRLKRKQTDLRDVTQSGVLSSSRRHLVFELDDLRAGGRLEVRAQIRERPYYPGTVVSLRPLAEPFHQVNVTVKHSASVEGFRYWVQGPLSDTGASSSEPESGDAKGLQVTETASGISLSGTWGSRSPSPRLAAGSEVSPVLYLAWDTSESWAGVARWYRGLLDGQIGASSAVKRQAETLLSGLPSDPQGAPAKRAKLEALLSFVRAKVRYVAVEVGIGGYRPTPAEETLDRKWGDCKDKSFLLIDLLRSSGVDAYPALIRLDGDGRIVTEFPSPFGFNHLIVAVPAEGLDLAESDPVADGFLFIDPTQTTGSSRYLHTQVQDQSALVVLPSEGRLIQTPVLPESQRIGLDVDLAIEGDGSASGRAEVSFVGDFGSEWAQIMSSSPPAEIEGHLRSMFQRLLPGADVLSLTWNGSTDGLPSFKAESEVRFEALVESMDRGGSLKLDGFQWAPEPGQVDELGSIPTSIQVATVENRFRLHLPDNLCPPKDRLDELDNNAAHFVQRISHEGNVVQVERRTRAALSWFEGADIEALKALAMAEHRAPKRRLRFRCP